MQLECFKKRTDRKRGPDAEGSGDRMAGADPWDESAVGSKEEVSMSASKRMGDSSCLEEKE